MKEKLLELIIGKQDEIIIHYEKNYRPIKGTICNGHSSFKTRLKTLQLNINLSPTLFTNIQYFFMKARSRNPPSLHTPTHFEKTSLPFLSYIFLELLIDVY